MTNESLDLTVTAVSFFTNIFNSHQEELSGLVVKMFPVLLGSEFVARVTMAWTKYRVGGSKEKHETFGRAISLTANGGIAFLFVLSIGGDWAWTLNTTCYYAGMTMFLHYLLIRFVFKRFGVPSYG